VVRGMHKNVVGQPLHRPATAHDRAATELPDGGGEMTSRACRNVTRAAVAGSGVQGDEALTALAKGRMTSATDPRWSSTASGDTGSRVIPIPSSRRARWR
jgi:hypothetical protein